MRWRRSCQLRRGRCQLGWRRHRSPTRNSTSRPGWLPRCQQSRRLRIQLCWPRRTAGRLLAPGGSSAAVRSVPAGVPFVGNLSPSEPFPGAWSGLTGSGGGRLQSPNGRTLTPVGYTRLHAALGDPRKLSLSEPAAAAGKIPAAAYNAYRATAQYVAPDGLTVRFAAGLRAGPQQSTAAMNATPAVRTALAAAAAASGATSDGVAGQAAALYDVSSTANGDIARG